MRQFLLTVALLIMSLSPGAVNAGPKGDVTPDNWQDCPGCGAIIPGGTGCTCWPEKKDEDCEGAKESLKNAIQNGSVWVEKNGKRLSPGDALKHVDSIGCGEAISAAKEYTGFGAGGSGPTNSRTDGLDAAPTPGQGSPNAGATTGVMRDAWSRGRWVSRVGRAVVERPPLSVAVVKGAGLPPGVDPVGQALKNIDDSGLPLWGPALQRPILRMGQEIQSLLKSATEGQAQGVGSDPAFNDAIVNGNHDKFVDLIKGQNTTAVFSGGALSSVVDVDVALATFPPARVGPRSVREFAGQPWQEDNLELLMPSFVDGWIPVQTRPRIAEFFIAEDYSYVIRRYEWVGHVDGEYRATIYSWVQRIPTGIQLGQTGRRTLNTDAQIRQKLRQAAGLSVADLRQGPTGSAFDAATSSPLRGFVGNEELNPAILLQP